MTYNELRVLSLEELIVYAGDILGFEVTSTTKAGALKQITTFKKNNNIKPTKVVKKPKYGVDLNKGTFTPDDIKLIDKHFRELTGRYFGIVTPATVKQMVDTLKAN